MQGVSEVLLYLTPLVQQGNLVEQLEDVIDDKFSNEVSCICNVALFPNSELRPMPRLSPAFFCK